MEIIKKYLATLLLLACINYCIGSDVSNHTEKFTYEFQEKKGLIENQSDFDPIGFYGAQKNALETQRIKEMAKNFAKQTPKFKKLLLAQINNTNYSSVPLTETIEVDSKKSSATEKIESLLQEFSEFAHTNIIADLPIIPQNSQDAEAVNPHIVLRKDNIERILDQDTANKIDSKKTIKENLSAAENEHPIDKIIKTNLHSIALRKLVKQAFNRKLKKRKFIKHVKLVLKKNKYLKSHKNEVASEIESTEEKIKILMESANIKLSRDFLGKLKGLHENLEKQNVETITLSKPNDDQQFTNTKKYKAKNLAVISETTITKPEDSQLLGNVEDDLIKRLYKLKFLTRDAEITQRRRSAKFDL